MTAPVAAPPELRDDLGRRLQGLTGAVTSARGRIDDETLAPAEVLNDRAAERLQLSGAHTIVALAGATGSGKSSLFNALTEMELAGVGVRRPTTSWALACAWGPDGAAELLTWMGIPPRHQVSRSGLLAGDHDTSLEGLILLDLPDHDSTEVAHHLEMDRLVTYSDLLVWVLDPQKYADAAIHERYIRPMAAHGAVTVVVLNQIDRIPLEHREQTIADVRRLVEADGLTGVEVLGVSATRGDGMEDLRRLLAGRIRAKSAAKARLAADVGDAAAAIAAVGGTAPAPTVGAAAVQRLEEAVTDQIGLHHTLDTIADATRRRVVRRTRWPLPALLRRGRRVPELTDPATVSVSALDVSVRDFVDEFCRGLAQPWRAAVHASVDTQQAADELTDRLAQPELRSTALPRWSRAVQVLQWLLMVDLAAGLLGLAAHGVERWTDLAARAPGFFDWLAGLPEPLGYPLAAWIAAGAAVAGIVLDLVGRIAARQSGRRRARVVRERTAQVVEGTVRAQVTSPVAAELDRYAAYRDQLLVALG